MSDPIKELEIHHFEDIRYSVTSKFPEQYDHFLHFEIYPWEGGEPIKDFENTLMLAEGDVKWDGCSNWMFTQAYHHFCEVEYFAEMGEAFARCWDIASRTIPGWDGGQRISQENKDHE